MAQKGSIGWRKALDVRLPLAMEWSVPKRQTLVAVEVVTIFKGNRLRTAKSKRVSAWCTVLSMD